MFTDYFALDGIFWQPKYNPLLSRLEGISWFWSSFVNAFGFDLSSWVGIGFVLVLRSPCLFVYTLDCCLSCFIVVLFVVDVLHLVSLLLLSYTLHTQATKCLFQIMVGLKKNCHKAEGDLFYFIFTCAFIFCLSTTTEEQNWSKHACNTDFYLSFYLFSVLRRH